MRAVPTVPAAQTAPQLRLDFTALDDSWAVESLEFELPGSLAIDTAPEGWACTDAPAICSSDAPDPSGGEFTLLGEAAPGEPIAVRWVARGERADYIATAGAPLPKPGASVTAEAVSK